MISITANLDNPKITGLVNNLEKHLSEAVRLTAFEVERNAKEAAPVDTGALRASILTVTEKSDGSASALKSASQPRKGRSGVTRQASVSNSFRRPKGPFQAVNAVGVKYGKHVNYGTAKMRARPFLTVAAWKARQIGRAHV